MRGSLGWRLDVRVSRRRWWKGGDKGTQSCAFRHCSAKPSLTPNPPPSSFAALFTAAPLPPLLAAVARRVAAGYPAKLPRGAAQDDDPATGAPRVWLPDPSGGRVAGPMEVSARATAEAAAPDEAKARLMMAAAAAPLLGARAAPGAAAEVEAARAEVERLLRELEAAGVAARAAAARRLYAKLQRTAAAVAAAAAQRGDAH